jgi:uncharacterized cupredoxin-like copper-binding protein
MKTLLTTVPLALLLLAGISLAGCATTRAQTTSTSIPQAQATSTSIPNAQTVAVTLTDTGIIATQTTFRPGVRYHFIITNHGTRPHQFWFIPQGMAQMMSNMPMAQWHQKVMFSTQNIGPGMSASVWWFTRVMRPS